MCCYAGAENIIHIHGIVYLGVFIAKSSTNNNQTKIEIWNKEDHNFLPSPTNEGVGFLYSASIIIVETTHEQGQAAATETNQKVI